MKKNITFISILSFIIILICIVLVGLMIYFKTTQKTVPQPETPIISKEPEKPKTTLPKALYNLAGEIQKIEKEAIFFEATIPQLDNAGNSIQKKFTSLTFVEVEPGKKSPQDKPITFQDLKIGNYIEVVSNHNIAELQEFEVTQIRLLSATF